MKPSYFYQIIFIFFLSTVGVSAQNSSNEPILISGTRFTYPLIEKWIAEYGNVNPTVRFKIEQKLKPEQVADLNIIAHQPVKEELKENQDVIFAGKYALLPVTNSKNPFLSTTVRKGLNKKDIDKLFFDVSNDDEETTNGKPKFAATIYSRDNKACTSQVIAGFFSHQSSEIRGKRVQGDDIYLLSAIKEDSIGLTYNNLGYLYDTNSRKLKDGIALLPLDLKKDAKNLLSGNLDNVIDVLERNHIETIPVEKIGFIYSQQTARKEVSDFLKWVLSDGQKFNHEKGFLNLDKEVLAAEINQLNGKFLSLK